MGIVLDDELNRMVVVDVGAGFTLRIVLNLLLEGEGIVEAAIDVSLSFEWIGIVRSANAGCGMLSSSSSLISHAKA